MTTICQSLLVNDVTTNYNTPTVFNAAWFADVKSYTFEQPALVVDIIEIG